MEPAKRKKLVALISALIILFTAAVLLLAVANAMMLLEANKKMKQPEELAGLGADCALVLGCGVYADGTPSPMLADRLDAGIALYESGAVKKLLVSGDHGSDEYDEVNVMRSYCLERGVPSEDIFMDHAGFSTYDSVCRAKKVFCVNSVVIVTQKYHLSRAIYIADTVGLDAVGVASDPRQYKGQAFRELREAAARVKDFILCIFKPNPTYLGELIPISGSGELTAG